MALHRKQRGVVDTSPQYVRIPTSGGRAVGYSLHEAHSSPQRVYSKRYMAGDRSRKISSLQLRACFLLCVLLYFGAIYFADDIASIGRVVGSEQNSQNFFVHSLRPRGRNVRIGRAVDTKKTELAAMPEATVATLNEHQHQLDETNPPMKVSEAVTQSPHVEFAKPEEAELMDSVKQAVRPADLKRHDQQKELIGTSGDAVHPDDQGGDAPADQIKHAEPIEKASIDQATALPVEFVKPDDHQHSGHGQEQDNDLNAAMKNNRVVVNDEPRPTAATRHHEKEAHVDAIPAASPSRVIQKQFAHGNIDDKPKHPQQLKRSQELGEIRPVVTRQQRRPADVTINGERGEENDPVATPAQMKEGLTEHISDI